MCTVFVILLLLFTCCTKMSFFIKCIPFYTRDVINSTQCKVNASLYNFTQHKSTNEHNIYSVEVMRQWFERGWISFRDVRCVRDISPLFVALNTTLIYYVDNHETHVRLDDKTFSMQYTSANSYRWSSACSFVNQISIKQIIYTMPNEAKMI